LTTIGALLAMINAVAGHIACASMVLIHTTVAIANLAALTRDQVRRRRVALKG